MVEEHRGWYRTHKLPHSDHPYVTQNITFRLHDSLPQELVRELVEELKHNPTLTVAQRKKIEKYLDAGYGTCYLRLPEIAKLVISALKHYDHKWYELVAWVVMPNHVHVLIHMQHNVALSDIVKAWKSYTAHQANKILERKGKFWQVGYFDRFIRDDKHYENAIHYIHNNPVVAGLATSPAAWRFSSATLWGLE